MKSIFILIHLSFFCLLCLAQSPSAEPVSISKDSALNLKNIQDVFNLPLSAEVSGGTVSLLSRKDKVIEPWKPAKGMTDPVIRQAIREAHSGDRLVFEGFTETSGDKKTKLEGKSFRFK